MNEGTEGRTMRYAFTTSDGRRMGYYPDTAGWCYGQAGACRDRSTHVDYPWHESHRGECVRCGEREPARRFVELTGAGEPAVAE